MSSGRRDIRRRASRTSARPPASPRAASSIISRPRKTLRLPQRPISRRWPTVCLQRRPIKKSPTRSSGFWVTWISASRSCKGRCRTSPACSARWSRRPTTRTPTFALRATRTSARTRRRWPRSSPRPSGATRRMRRGALRASRSISRRCSRARSSWPRPGKGRGSPPNACSTCGATSRPSSPQLRSMSHGQQAENHDVPLVRQQRRGGDEALRLDLQELEDPERDAKRQGGTRPRRNGLGRQLPDRGPGVHRAQRRSAIQIHRSHLPGGELRLAERSGRSVEEALRGRRAGAVRLAQGQVRFVLADRSARHDQAAAGQGSREVATRHAGDDADDQDRHCSTAAGLSRPLAFSAVPDPTQLFIQGATIMPKPAVKPIPDGMHSLTPLLTCAGAADAIKFYTKAFNAVELSRLSGPKGKLMHAMLRIGNSALMLTDEFPEWGGFGPKSLKGSPVTVHLYVENADAAVEQAVAAGARIALPLQDMLWGDRYAPWEDPFGHPRSIGTHTRHSSPAEIQEAMGKASAA